MHSHLTQWPFFRFFPVILSIPSTLSGSSPQRFATVTSCSSASGEIGCGGRSEIEILQSKTGSIVDCGKMSSGHRAVTSLETVHERAASSSSPRAVRSDR